MKSVERLSEELIGDLLQLYVKYRNQGMPGSMIIGIVEDLKTRLLAQHIVRAMQGSDSERRRPVTLELAV